MTSPTQPNHWAYRFDPPSSGPTGSTKMPAAPVVTPVVASPAANDVTPSTPATSSAPSTSSTIAGSSTTAGSPTAAGQQSQFHRVDHSHVATDRTSHRSPLDETSVSTAVAAEPVGREAWLKLHATDLIRRLQTWATDLDAREADLNASFARQDLRERRFRLHQQEIEIQMAQHQQAANELQEQMQAHARRLAFQSL